MKTTDEKKKEIQQSVKIKKDALTKNKIIKK